MYFSFTVIYVCFWIKKTYFSYKLICSLSNLTNFAQHLPIGRANKPTTAPTSRAVLSGCPQRSPAPRRRAVPPRWWRSRRLLRHSDGPTGASLLKYGGNMEGRIMNHPLNICWAKKTCPVVTDVSVQTSTQIWSKVAHIPKSPFVHHVPKLALLPPVSSSSPPKPSLSDTAPLTCWGEATESWCSWWLGANERINWVFPKLEAINQHFSWKL